MKILVPTWIINADVQNPEVRAKLENQLAELRQELAEGGYRTRSFEAGDRRIVKAIEKKLKELSDHPLT